MARATKPPKRNSWANAAAGSPDIEESALVDTGWTPAGVIPSRGEFNFEQHRYDEAGNYLMQRGVSDWAADETDYDTFDLVRASDGKVYMLIGTATPATAPQSDLTNWHLVLRDKRPMAGETVADPSEVFYNGSSVENRPVSGRDAFGFLAGRTRLYEENWNDAARVVAGGLNANGNGAFLGPWRYRLTGGSGSFENIHIFAPGSPATLPYGSYAGLNVGGVPTGGACALLEYALPISYFNQTPVSFECMFTLNGATPPQNTSSFAIGLGDGTLFNAASVVPINGGGAEPRGAFFVKEAGGSVFGVWTRAPGSPSGSGVSPGTIARDTHYYYKCVAVGENDSPDGDPHVYHFLNGALILTSDVSMANWTPTPFLRVTADGGPETCFLNVGRVRCQVKFGEGSLLI